MKATYTPVSAADNFNGSLIDKYRLAGLSYGIKIIHKSTFKEVLEMRCYNAIRGTAACALWVRFGVFPALWGTEQSATGTAKQDPYAADSDAFRVAAEKAGFTFDRDQWDSLTNFEALQDGCLAICEAVGYFDLDILMVRFYPG